jgi:hypothetical protein
LGVPADILLPACDDVRNAGNRSASQCAAFRRAVPWAMIEGRIAAMPKPTTRFKLFHSPEIPEKPKPVGGYGRAATKRK